MSGHKKGLGKGLESLLAIDTTDYSKSTDGVLKVSLDKIQANIEQPRKEFIQASLQELADSIREKGVIQPIIVEEVQHGQYKIIAGERRFRASKLAGLSEIPVLVRNYTQEDAFEIALIENIQREDLNAIEEAMGYKTLMEKFNLTQDEVAKKVGKNRTTITNSLRLLKLPQIVLTSISQGEFSAGLARAVLSVEPDKQIDFFNAVKDRNMSVREAEEFARTLHADLPIIKKASDIIQTSEKSIQKNTIIELAEFEEKLRFTLGTKVSVKGNSESGKIEIFYYSSDDLERLSELISK